MAAGYYAITQTIQGSVTDQSHFDHAALALGLAVLFDGLDGIIARMTNTASDFGKELDSLAMSSRLALLLVCWLISGASACCRRWNTRIYGSS